MGELGNSGSWPFGFDQVKPFFFISLAVAVQLPMPSEAFLVS
jgi:hypothetical protein